MQNECIAREGMWKRKVCKIRGFDGYPMLSCVFKRVGNSREYCRVEREKEKEKWMFLFPLPGCFCFKIQLDNLELLVCPF